jgi:F-type H+-transporting ATPase subunit c
METLMGTVLAVAEGGESMNTQLALFGAAIACGVIIIGAGIGIGIIAGKAVESIARQPESHGRIFSAMIVAAALIEGVTFFALLICFLAIFWLK